MATIRKKRGKWQVLIRKKFHTPISKTFVTKEDAKQPKKIKPTEPVKIDFNLTPMHTASLMSNIRDSSIYKLLKNPKVIGVDLGHDAIIEAINILQSSGLLKEGGIVK